jgi:hypothetical protein
MRGVPTWALLTFSRRSAHRRYAIEVRTESCRAPDRLCIRGCKTFVLLAAADLESDDCNGGVVVNLVTRMLDTCRVCVLGNADLLDEPAGAFACHR